VKKKIALATLAMIPIAVNTAHASSQTGIVTANSLNVRSGPGTNYTVLFAAKKNEKVDINETSNGWYKIKMTSGKEGWASSTHISKSNSNDNSNELNTSGLTKKVSINRLNMRSGGGTSYRTITTLNKGIVVDIVSESNGWTKIKYDGRLGYVSSEYLEAIKQESSNKTTKEVNIDNLNVRNGPNTSYGVVGKLKKGEKINVLSEDNGWTKISYTGREAYTSSRYLKEVSSYSNPIPTPNLPIETPNTGEDTSENINGSTVNYKALSYTLNDHVSVQQERANIGANVIDSSKVKSSQVMTTFAIRENRSFITANKNDLQYFLNPNNFTNNSQGMMQFLKIDSYKGGISAGELNSYLNSLSQASSGTNVFYNQGQMFINAAQKYNIDLAYLVSHAMWETGYGKSILAQGQTITSFKGKPLDAPVKVYNFFGIGAIDKSANVSGAEAAYSNGWTSIEATINGSAQWIAQNYIKSSKYNQNTIYKMKFNYDYSWHQYATDVNWANGISGIMNKIVGMYDTRSNLTFEVPSYKK
jgi:beta-N-acetylglucosaminidase/uncharacterized protein YraI